jgi:thiamine-monophosphate kinase
VRENDLLQHIYAGNAALPPFVTLPPGDDMAALTWDDPSLLIAVDQIADGVHFRLADTPLDRIARKALTRNLSDVAAMAAEPVAAVVAASLPRDFSQPDAAALCDALQATAAEFACPIVGGDLSVWAGPLLLAVTVLARPWSGVPPITRAAARPGDAIFVTGQLGYSFPTGHHLTFTPRLNVARTLGSLPDPAAGRPTAMIDLSDGIAQDLPRLTEHAALDARRLPIRSAAKTDDIPAWRHALGDGEDYELLFTADAHAPLPDATDSVPLTRIGTVTDAGGLTVITPEGRREPLDGGTKGPAGWEHGR